MPSLLLRDQSSSTHSRRISSASYPSTHIASRSNNLASVWTQNNSSVPVRLSSCARVQHAMVAARAGQLLTMVSSVLLVTPLPVCAHSCHFQTGKKNIDSRKYTKYIGPFQVEQNNPCYIGDFEQVKHKNCIACLEDAPAGGWGEDGIYLHCDHCKFQVMCSKDCMDRWLANRPASWKKPFALQPHGKHIVSKSTH